MRTLVELLYERSVAHSSDTLYVCLGDGDTPEEQLSYEALVSQVCALGNQLKTYNLQGRRALLFYPSGPDYIRAFFSCAYAGIIAVPLYPPRKNQSIHRLLSVITNAQPAAILTTEKIARYARELFSEAALTGIQWIITDEPLPAQSSWEPVSAKGDDIAFLQYTSGSVGDPKGVMVTHNNLLCNQEMIFRTLGSRESPTIVGWLPLYHDMGLICNLLQPIYASGRMCLMSPAGFLQKPYRWLKAVSDYQAVISGGPNFAYELCRQRITPEQRATLDLSAWKVAFNGAEPVNMNTLEQFYQTFRGCGFRRESFYPCYGLAEATLAVSGIKQVEAPVIYHANGKLLQQNILQAAAGDESGQAVPLVGCGLPAMQEIVITDPATRKDAGEEAIGEIWISGDNVAKGYWNDPARTAETFEAELEGRPGKHFLRTGDLGFLKDGALYVTGRLKELIIIRGRNIYPQDVERIAESAHEALQPFAGAAFSVTTAGEEQLVIVQEVKRVYCQQPDTDGMVRAIRAAVALQYDIPVHAIWLIRAGSIPKTSSGKIQRTACKQAFMENNTERLNLIGKWESSKTTASSPIAKKPEVTLTVITEWLRTAIAQQCQVAPEEIQARDAFDKFGLDSMAAAGISGALSEWSGREVSPTVVYDYPTIHSLAAWLYENISGSNAAGQSRTASLREPSRETLPEPIAVVGIGCRFPEAPDHRAFWQLISSGASAIHTVPAGRWPLEHEVYKDYDYIRNGGFLDNIDEFDAGFFGISAREAAKMDPQQRLLLEVSWAAFEDAGIAPAGLAGKQVGVFVGISANDYLRLQQNVSMLDAYNGTGNAASIAANRLSYFYDFRGPSLSVDTACSSSLVAVHHACRSLQQQECNVALAAGVNIMAAPDLSLIFAKSGMLSPDGVCKTFDANANGYVRGEGCGVVLLKRLSDAVKDGNTIYGIIRGTAVNQDGRSNGLTAPNGPSQEAVIRTALAAAGVAPHEVSLIEAHGTGTSLGDPIEMNALRKVLSTGREKDRPCYIGSVKTNIGHLEAAAGMAGLIKVLLCLHHRQVAPHLHIKTLNPKIEPDPSIIIPSALVPLVNQGPVVAGISSFGFGGTNAHVVVAEGAPAPEALPAQQGPDIVLLSAQDESILPVAARQLLDTLHERELPLRDVAATLLHGRNHLQHRQAFVAADQKELKEKLKGFIDDQSITGNKPSATLRSPKMAMLFTGQGAQYAMMAHGLYKHEQVFRETLDMCSSYLQPLLGVSLTDLLYVQQDDQRIHQTAITQPLLFSVEVSLARLWESWGIRPDAVMGHSVGEIAAACMAGVFSLEDGLKLIATRGALMQSLPAGGQMWALMATVEQVTPFLKGYERYISVASVNAPTQVVIAGDGEQLKPVIAALQGKKILCNPLKVSHAFHSPLMEPIIGTFMEKISNIRFSAPNIPLLSNVSGAWAGTEITTPEYWANHILAPVLFSKSVQALRQEGFNIFLEAGPHPVLNNLARQTLGVSGDTLLLPSIINKSDNSTDILQSLGALYAQGFAVNGEGIYPAGTYRQQSLPGYPFKRERFWLSDEEMLPAAGLQGALLPGASTGGGQAAELLYKKYWEQSYMPASHTLSPGEEVVLAVTDDIPLVTQLLKNGFGKKKHLILLLPESLKDTLSPAIVREHEIIYHKADSVDLYHSVLQDILHNRAVTCSIILAFNLDNPAYTATETSVKLLYPCYNRILYILQAISSLSVKEDTCRMLLITPSYSHISTGVPVYPPAAVLAAMMRCARLEMPELRIKTVEADVASRGNWEAIVEAELLPASFAEIEVSYQQGQRYVSRLKEQSAKATDTAALFKAESIYLITGANSAMAASLLGWMTARGARHFLLVGRKAPQEAHQQKIAEHVTAAGGSVVWCQADVSSDDAVTQLQQQLTAAQKELGGIFHLAGVLKDAPIHHLSWQDMEPVFDPKVAGTLNLHQLSLDHHPDWFVCFSSVAALLGSPYQCSYAAANAFMDAFADYRQQQGLPAISINWGPWEGAGMAAEATSHKIGGVELIQKTSVSRNLAALELILANRISGAAVIAFNRETAPAYFSKIPFLQQLNGIRHPQQGSRQTAGPSFRQQLLTYTKAEQSRQLGRMVSQEVSRVLGPGVKKTAGLHDTFVSLGMDSMMTVELQQRLQQALEVNFSAAAIYNYNTVHSLTAFLLDKMAVYGRADNNIPVFTLFHAAANGDKIDIDALGEEAATALLEEVLRHKNITL